MTTILTKSPRRKVGRPEKFTPATRRRLIETIAAGVPVCHACAACRVSKSGFHEYRAEHPDFAAKIEQATAVAIEKHLHLIIAAAEQGSTADSRWYLERVHPQHFGRTRIELTGTDGAPLAAAIGIYLPQKDAPETKTLPAIVTTSENEN